jgi:hypothetical protein
VSNPATMQAAVDCPPLRIDRSGGA